MNDINRKRCSHQRNILGRKTSVYLVFCLSLAVSLIGCTRSTATQPAMPDQPQQPEPTADHKQHYLPLILGGEKPVTENLPPEQPAEDATLTPGPTSTPLPFTNTPLPTATSTLTPTPCHPPAGWVAYIVQPYDTLYSLAQKTNTTVEEIQRANCLVGASTIYVGQVLYLPFLPPTNTPLPPTKTPLPPTSTFTPKPKEPTLTPSPDWPDIVLAPGGGNDPNFVPCNNPAITDPWIDTHDDSLEIGERRYFFACNFGNAIVNATVTMSNGQANNAQVLTTMPNPILQMGNANAVIPWSALPTHPLGMYTMTVTDSGGVSNAYPLNFWIEQPNQAYILAVPPENGPGSAFIVYFVNFTLNSTLSVERYREVSFDGQKYTFRYLSNWDITIANPLQGSSNGWAQHTIQTDSSDSGLANLIHHQQQVHSIFWVR